MTKHYKWIQASVKGSSHILSNIDRQDYLKTSLITSNNNNILIATISDGAGSTSKGKHAAIIACEIINSKLKEHFYTSIQLPNDEQIWFWIDEIRETINFYAKKKNTNRKEFASTLICLIISNNNILCLHIGDGCIVAQEKSGDWTILSNSENGEYASTTYFINEDPSPRLRISRFDNKYNAFALFSDGIENITIDQSDNSPHAPFLNFILERINNAKEINRNKELSKNLKEYLNSSTINEKTDDDKSLIMVSYK